MKRLVMVSAIATAACSHPASAPTPVAADTAITAPPAVMDAAPNVRAVAGAWRITTDIASQRRSGPPRGGTLSLGAGVSGTPDAMIHDVRQYVATASIPGFANPPAESRGRGQGRRRSDSATPTTWWPASGDSVVIHIVGARGNRIDLRGRLAGGRIAGEVWMTSLESGNTFQLGNFTATRTR